MKKTLLYKGILLVTLTAILFTSCKKKNAKDPAEEIKGNYFSIRQFALDEWNTFAGQPFTIVKTVQAGGKIDSSYTTSDTMNWTGVFQTFFETDISDRKFLGQYTFTQFDDNADGTHNFFYEAKDEDLYTQKLLITIAQFTNKVKGIYVETSKKSITGDQVQKLYYSPLKTIQIQTDEKPMIGDKKHTVLQYDFMR